MRLDRAVASLFARAISLARLGKAVTECALNICRSLSKTKAMVFPAPMAEGHKAIQAACILPPAHHTARVQMKPMTPAIAISSNRAPKMPIIALDQAAWRNWLAGPGRVDGTRAEFPRQRRRP
eukprot:1544046-Amphidinium_carterae.1